MYVFIVSHLLPSTVQGVPERVHNEDQQSPERHLVQVVPHGEERHHRQVVHQGLMRHTQRKHGVLHWKNVSRRSSDGLDYDDDDDDDGD